MLEILKNKPIIINTDLDGIISGLFLQNYLNCAVVGFSNSAENIWLQTNFVDLKEVCFIDLFVANPNIICLDQHIVSVNKEHHKILKNNPNKINPNLLNQRYFLPDSSYYKKYPFGTIHFIIALLEREGFSLINLDWCKTVHNVQFIDLLLRADDTMHTSVNSNYVENANEWWFWLQNFSNKGETILKLKDYLSKIPKEIATKTKINISKILQSKPFNCDSPDGGIAEITKGIYLKENVKQYFKFISKISSLELFNLESSFKKYHGKTSRLSLNKEFQEELITSNRINANKIFSYAFVRSSKRDYNFSATFYQKND